MLLNEAIKKFITHVSAEQRSDATIKGYGGALMRFCLYARNPQLELITPELVDQYFKQCSELGWKRNSMVAPAIAMRKLFEYWRRKGYPGVLDYELLPLISKEGAEPRVASQESVAKVLAQCQGDTIYDIRNRAVILMLGDTGMRNGELCSLNVDTIEEMQVEEENGIKQYSCIIRSEKRRTSQNPHRRVFWYEDTQTALKKWLVVREKYVKLFPPRDPDALFISTKESHGKIGTRMTPYTVGLVLRRLSIRAGIPTVNPHSLRHKFGSDSAEQGLNNSNISDLMGHANLTSSFVYTHLRGRGLGAAHRKVKGDNMSSP